MAGAIGSNHNTSQGYPHGTIQDEGSERAPVLIQSLGILGVNTGIDNRPAKTKEEREAGAANPVMGAGILADYGRFKLNGIDGTNYGLPLSTSFKITDRVGLNLGLPLIYSKVGGATAYGVGVSVELPVLLFDTKDERGFLWQLTPAFGGTGVASKTLETGGVILSGGISSLACYDFGLLSISVGNHISTYESTNAKFSGYRYENGVSQRVIRNGLKVDVPISRRWVVDAYAIHNKLSGSSVLDSYMTYGADLAFRVTGDQKKTSGGLGQISVGFRTDQGTGYRATNVQFGSGWKF